MVNLGVMMSETLREKAERAASPHENTPCYIRWRGVEAAKHWCHECIRAWNKTVPAIEEALREAESGFQGFEVVRCEEPKDGKPPRYHIYGIRASGVKVGMGKLYLRDIAEREARRQGHDAGEEEARAIFQGEYQRGRKEGREERESELRAEGKLRE